MTAPHDENRPSPRPRLGEPRALGWLLFALLLAGQARAHPPSYVLFESGPVRPLALSPDGTRLFAVNIPDGQLEIFDASEAGLVHRGAVAVGLEPVAVAARSDGEVWVVNHLSDSVSIVDVASVPPRVARTLLVGDEPRDIVFAGSERSRAFVTTAHRGQHRTDPSLDGVPGAGDPKLLTEGIGRADVWVFDAADTGSGLGGRPLAILSLFGDTPRALAATPDGETVYAAVFHSGNRTATVSSFAVCDGFVPSNEADACPEALPGMPGGLLGPVTNHQGAPAPEVGLIARYDAPTGAWRDVLGRDWRRALRFTLPDLDVFRIDAGSLEVTASYAGVGTVLFNMAVNPATGTLYVSNTESANHVRFEGAGAFGGSTVQGHLAESRITVIDEHGVAPRHLNRHLDYRERPAGPGAQQHSLATPLDLTVSPDGATLYVAAFGSSRIGVYRTAELEQNTFDPRGASGDHIALGGGGPSGVVLSPGGERLFVATRFDNAVAVVDLATRSEIQRFAMHSPEPPSIVAGRPLLYDATLSSSNGEASCASCHVFGDTDSLAWDLGDPDGDVTQSPIEIVFGDAIAEQVIPTINGTGRARDIHPMKGPMATQTLRGLVNAGAMHWRGDRATGVFGTDPFDTDLSFRNFVVAFQSLLGKREPLAPIDMRSFTDFALRLTLPPNPVRNLDNTETPSQRRGRDFYFGPRRSVGQPPPSELGFTCNECHSLAPQRGHFGTDGRLSLETVSQIFKIPHLRTQYQKVGMFGTPQVAGNTLPDPGELGPQVRGIGYLHDGSIDHLFRFFHGAPFREREEVGLRGDGERRAMADFMLAFPSDLAPIVGQQVTLSARAPGPALARLDLLEERARTPFASKILGDTARECDLIAKGLIGGEARGFSYDAALGRYLSDRLSEPPRTATELRASAALPGHELTFTCAPPGSGVRMGIDRDLDGARDRDEIDAQSDPADAASRPTQCVATPYQLCLEQGRFAVSIRWQDFAGTYGAGRVVGSDSETSAPLWFFAPDNWEVLVKVLDGCTINGHFWVFAAATTTVGYELTVRDLWTAQTRVYGNPLGASARPVGDTSAFATCGAARPTPLPSQNRDPAPVPPSLSAAGATVASTAASICAGEPSLCLQRQRFRVEVIWSDEDGDDHAAQPAALGTGDSAILWFFDPANWEVLVKVLDGCAINGRYWVFAAALTDVAHTLRVTDTETGDEVLYRHSAGALAPAIADTGAFATCGH